MTAALLFVAAGCATDTPASIEEATFAPSLGVDLAASTKLTSGMYYRDIVVGGGAVVSSGQLVSVRYTGFLINGTVFDARTAGQAPFVFQLGVGQVIQGWDLGVAGMKIGGKRQLIIPPDLGYGAGGQGSIPGNSILVFSVEVVAAS